MPLETKTKNQEKIRDELLCTHCYSFGVRDELRIAVSKDQILEFCCHGCQAAFFLINPEGQDLQHLLPYSANIEKWLTYDQKDVQKDILLFNNEKVAVLQLVTPSIHCSSCVTLLEGLPKIEPSIIRSSVNFVQKELEVVFRIDKTPVSRLLALIESIGYPPVIKRNKADERNFQRQLLIKIGVAGFCFGNIMLLSFPDYLSEEMQSFGFDRMVFQWLSLIIALPVFFYSGNDYLKNAWTHLKHWKSHIDIPIAIGMTALFLTSCWILFVEKGTGYFDSLAGLVFFLLIGKWYQNRTYKSLHFDRDYSDYFPLAVRRVRAGIEEVVPVRSLLPGDEVSILDGEIIPVDSTLLSGEAQVDYSFITGETELVPIEKGEGIWAGGRQQGAKLKIRVDKAVENSYLTSLWGQHEFQREKGDFSSLISRISGYFTISIVFIAIATGLVWMNIDSSKALLNAAAVLIVACPCALALSYPFAAGTAMRLLSKNGFFIKDASVIEGLSKIKGIVFDKTGTLTQRGNIEMNYIGDVLSDQEEEIVKAMVENSSHPLSRALSNNLGSSSGIELRNYESVTGKGIIAFESGMEYRLGSESFVKSTSPFSDKHGTSESAVFISINGNFKGYFKIKQHFRKGIDAMLNKLKNKFKIYLVSGDRRPKDDNVLEHFNEEYFRQKPEEKFKFLTSKQKEVGPLMMVGDGLNDAGALKASDIGVSIADDIYQFTPASDIILDSSKLEKLEQSLDFSHKVMSIIWLSLFFSFAYNVLGLYFAVSGKLTPLICAILMPASSVSIVAFVTLLTRHRFKSSF